MICSGRHRVAIALATAGMAAVAFAAFSASSAHAGDTRTTASAPRVTLSISTPAHRVTVPRRKTITLVGDSITQGVDTHEWPHILASRLGGPAAPAASTYALSGGSKGDRLVCGDWTLYDSGVNGRLTAEMAGAAWDTDVLGHGTSDYIVIMGGTNDIRSRAVATTDIIANLVSMRAKAEKAGAVPILCTILPLNNGTAEQKRQIHELNEWIRTSSGASYVDFYAMAEASPGSATQIGGDGVHPTEGTHFSMGLGFDLALFGVARPPVRTVTSSHGLRGSISPLGTFGLDDGADSSTYTITPSAGAVIADVVVDGVSQGPVESFRFAGLGGDHWIRATFSNPDSDTDTVYAAHAPSVARRRGRFTIYGYLEPGHASGARSVLLRFYRFDHTAHKYRYYKTLRPSLRTSANPRLLKYRITTSLPSSGTWRVRAVARGAGGRVSRGGYGYVKVRKRLTS